MQNGMDIFIISVMFILLLRSQIHGNNFRNELIYQNDPSVENPSRPPLIDDRAELFNMSAKQALEAMDQVHTGQVDCKKMLETRNLKLLNLKYENSVYTNQANIAIRTANLVSDLLPTGSSKAFNLTPPPVLEEHADVLYAIVRNNLESEPLLVGSSITFDNNSFAAGNFYAPYAYRNANDTYIKVTDLSVTWSYLHEEFVKVVRSKCHNRLFPRRKTYFYPHENRSLSTQRLELTHRFVESIDGLWSRPYFECTTAKAWLVTYTAPILGNWDKNGPVSFMGMATIDIALTKVDINQCDKGSGGHFQFEIFAGTHHCKNETTQCEPVHGRGFIAGSYKCVCKPGHYFPNATASRKYFNGSVIEAEAADSGSAYYSNPASFQCYACQLGCKSCVDNSPCVVFLNWPLRKALMGLTVVTIIAAISATAFVVNFRELKVVKTASPRFLAIILLGCVLLYCEILVVYPEPQDALCIVRLWFRHIGFGLCFTSLLLKTWRISVIFRVKSAQKIKLTDQHLLHRFAPLMTLYVVYLLAWSLAGPSHVVEKKMPGDLRFEECSIDWWDHAILIFEVTFLFWGIHLCYNIRKAPSAFNESKFISCSIYNLTVVTILLKVTRLFIGDLAGPDMIYLLEFFRVQLGVSVLLGLVFVPKILRVVKGRGDVIDTSGRIASAKGAALNMGPGSPSSEGTVNLSQQNEDLKEEIRKLYGQLQQMKTMNMEAGNRHLVRSTSLLFGSTPSLLGPANNTNTNNAGLIPSSRKEKQLQRHSPAAELASDFV